MNTHMPISIPVGTHVLGRTLNARGEPIDQHGLISGEAVRVPIYITVSTTDKIPAMPIKMVETGIKPIDLLAPIPRGGVIAMLSEQGLGKMVVMEEIMHNFNRHQHGYIVFVGVSEGTYDATVLRDMIRDIEVEDRIVMVYEQREQSTGQQQQQLLRTGLTIAAYFSDQRHEVMLIVGEDVIAQDNHALLSELQQAARAKEITTFLFGPQGDINQLAHNSTHNAVDGQIVFSRSLAKRGLWPAIDRLATRSHLLESGFVNAEHVQVAQQVRQLLQRYTELHQRADAEQLSATDQQVEHRATKVQFFLTQPFSVAEAYTDLPGEYVPVEETVKSFKALLEGRYDAAPDEAFNFVGTIEQALAKAGK